MQLFQQQSVLDLAIRKSRFKAAGVAPRRIYGYRCDAVAVTHTVGAGISGPVSTFFISGLLV
jgi:hypothetical protein